MAIPVDKVEIYNKLVRDKIPTIITKKGDIPIYRTAINSDEITMYLSRKLLEETIEFLNGHELSEMADLVEVLETLANELGYTQNDLLIERKKKSDKCGSFKNNFILEKIIRKDGSIMREFEIKNDCKLYIPTETKNDELFLVELLDICQSYIEPLKYGFSREEIIDFISSDNFSDLKEFLKYKRYIVDDSSFLDLAKAYSTSNKYVVISFNDITYEDIENFFGNYKLCEIRNLSPKDVDINEIIIDE